LPGAFEVPSTEIEQEGIFMTNFMMDERRWKGIVRPYTQEAIERLRPSVQVQHTLATLGAERLWQLLQGEGFIQSLGALTGNQAVQQVQAGLKAIYVSGWQVAADANRASHMYPDQSLYPADSVPALVRAINNSLLRADQVCRLEGRAGTNWLAPIVADAEAGFGGMLNAFEIMKAMIEAGAAAVHFEDQLSSAKKCGHLGGKVLVPASEFIQKLIAARLAADVMGVPTVLIARTDADAAKLLLSDIDPRDEPFLTGGRTTEGFFHYQGGLDAAIARGLMYAPYADILWCETSEPDFEQARRFAAALHARYPGKLLAYNCSPSFHWKKLLTEHQIGLFQTQLSHIGYKYQFVTLAGFHSLNAGMFELACDYSRTGMSAYARLQEREFTLAESDGYSAIRHQSFVGTGYFDAVQNTITSGQTATAALEGSTEEAQFAPIPTQKVNGAAAHT
jgi:isocitrate lyase